MRRNVYCKRRNPFSVFASVSESIELAISLLTGVTEMLFLWLEWLMHPSMLSRCGERPDIGGGFESSHRPVVGTFDRFNGFSSNILLTFSCYFDNPQMPWGGAFEQKLSAQFKCPAYAPPHTPPPLLPSS